MKTSRLLLSLSVILLLVMPLTMLGDEKPAEEKPKAQPAGNKVPKNVLDKIDKPMQVPRGVRLSQNQLLKRLQSTLKLAKKAEAKYPNATNIIEVRGRMLYAANKIARIKKDEPSVKEVLAIAARILESKASPQEKLMADFLTTQAKVVPLKGRTPKDAEKHIRALVGRYEKTDAAATAVIYATSLAVQTKNNALVNELADVLENKHLDEEGVRGFLRDRLGRHPDVGRPFVAKLPLLDGKTLNLPDDLKGKVLVIDFWATWCMPCIEEIPNMKKLYKKYKPRGVEFVGISLDSNKKTLTNFISDRKLKWLHTFSGKGWSDPTARKYGIGGIPSIWVVGKDGKVVSDAARGRLERLIKQALKAPVSKPKTKSAPKP